MTLSDTEKMLSVLERIAHALEQKNSASETQLTQASSYLWNGETEQLTPIEQNDVLPLDLLVGLEQHSKTLHENTAQFAQGFAANNALLWGARGTGKSSLVKAIHHDISKTKDTPLILIEIHREDLPTLLSLLTFLQTQKEKRFVLFCDDLSFDAGDSSYKSLKTILEGGIAPPPSNVLFYATSNRRHLMPRDMIDNARRHAIHASEAVEEAVSLSDRFGLWLGFYPCDQDDYLTMIDNYAEAYDIPVESKKLHHQALEWEKTRGARSGRVAWQFIRHIAGQYQIKL